MSLRIKKIDALIVIIMIVIAGFVLYKVGYMPEKKEKDLPDIQFIKDEDLRTLTVKYVSEKVFWMDIKIEGTCDLSSLGGYIKVGDQITECVGTIEIWYEPANTLLYKYIFEKTPQLPYTLLASNYRDVSPKDEGAHFNTIANIREWWTYTVIFDEDSDLPGWTATISFMHMAWGDLTLTFKPDILVVTLHSPDGKKYGGLINKQRGEILGVLGKNTLEAKSPGVDITYEDSWALGEAPRWRVHAEDNDIDSQNEIVMDLEFFAPSSPLWIHSERIVDKGDGNIANYIFTGCEVTGEVILDGLKYEVEGLGHHEHSWSLGVVGQLIKGWDICHMRLDNGWNIYYSKYYLTRQFLPTQTTKVNPYSTLIITTDQGASITPLEDIDITIKDSDKIALLLKMPNSIKINAEPSLTQLLLKTYNIKFDIEINDKNLYDKTWKFPAYVGMKIGMSSVLGKIKWSDDDGDHEIDLEGSGSTWYMRKF